MSELTPVERRLSAALERIARGVEAMGARAAPEPVVVAAPVAPPRPAPDAAEVNATGSATIAALRQSLEKERAQSAQLNDRVAQLRQRQETTVAQLERRLARLTEQLDLQSLEMLRLKKANARLIEANAGLRQAQAEAYPDATLVNRSISAELEALQAERRVEMAEMEEILAELKPLVGAAAAR